MELSWKEPDGEERFEDLRFPFVTLYDAGRYSRILSGRVVSEEGFPVKRLAFKIQRDEYSIGLDPSTAVGENNLMIDGMWERELGNLRAFASSSSQVVGILGLGLKQPLKPILFCKRNRVFIRPRCPRCSTRLTVCRDDNFLAKRMLSSYSKSLERFLYCPSCAAQEPDQVPLYQHQTPCRETMAKGVGGPTVLYHHMIASRLAEPAGNRFAGDADEEVLEDLFCLSCGSREECFAGDPAGASFPAQIHLLSLGFYDFYLLPMELMDLRYDEFSKVLSGLSREQKALHDGKVSADQGLCTEPKAPVSACRRYFFPPGSQQALEIFYLKLSLFRRLCQGVWQFHAACKAPHLQLRPENVMVGLSETPAPLPLFWGFDVKLIDVASGQAFVPDPELSEYFSGIWHPAKDVDHMYSAPVTRQQFGQQGWVTFRLQNTGEDPSNSTKSLCCIQGSIASDTIDFGRLSQKDLIHMLLHHEYIGSTGAEFWCKKKGNAGKRCLIEGYSRKVGPRERERMQMIQDKDIEVRVSVFPAFSIPCDLYSLGMMLLDTLLSNASNDRLDIRKMHQSVCSLLEIYCRNHPEAREEELITYFRDVCRLDWVQKVAGRNNISFDPSNHPIDASQIPETLWLEAVQLSFALASSISGFSVCADHGDFSIEHPEEKLGRLLLWLDDLLERVYSEMFQVQRSNKAIRRVLRQLSAEWKDRNSGEPPLSS